jgi:hypothetical protein
VGWEGGKALVGETDGEGHRLVRNEVTEVIVVIVVTVVIVALGPGRGGLELL